MRRWPKSTHMKILKISILVVVLAFTSFYSLYAEDGGPKLKKIIAIGDVDTGYMGFSGVSPQKLAKLMRDRIKNELENTGNYIVVLPEIDEQKMPNMGKMPKVPEAKSGKQMTQKEAMAYMAEMQKAMTKMQKAMKGVYDPVAAGALFSFNVRQGKSWTDTGGVTGTIGVFTSAPVDLGDFSSETLKVSLVAMQQNPENWDVIEEHSEKASSTDFTRVAGSNYYSASGSEDYDRAFDRMFKRSLKKTIKWIDDRMSQIPWQGQIIKEKGNVLYLNAGSNAGLAKGMVLSAFKRQKVSGGGIDLGSDYLYEGKITVSDVKEKFATASVSEGKVGDGYVVRLK